MKTVSNVIVNFVLSVVLNIKFCYLACRNSRNSSKVQKTLNIINTRIKKKVCDFFDQKRRKSLTYCPSFLLMNF